jgi:two-component system response regulator LytT
VIFTTAYDEYAIHAFRVNAVDYLLKPLAIDEVKRALEKYRKLSRPQVLPDIEKLYEMISCQRTNSRRNILVAYKDKLLPIPTEKIAFFYSTKETSRVYLADGSNYAYNRTLESICDDMDPRAFCRVNKQYVVAREHITSIVVWSNSRLLVSMEPRRPSPYS